MKDVFVVADNVFSPLGKTSAQNFEQLTLGKSGIRQHAAGSRSPVPFYAALFTDDDFDAQSYLTRFEQLLAASAADALAQCDVDASGNNTVLIISSTKGNISMLEDAQQTEQLEQRIALHTSASLVAQHLGFVNKPVVVSHACISGLLAIITAQRLLASGRFENAVVVGADVITRFVLSGFQCFQAISGQPCRPFDAARDGITLGEAAGTIILSANERYRGHVKIAGGAVSNDANHISGPSKTGEELFFAIQSALKQAALLPAEVDFISAHGTATLYNDEMEAKAVNIAGMQQVPLNSLKGYYGHTLGAAGIIETVMSAHSLKHGLLIPTLGYTSLGVTQPVNIYTGPVQVQANNFLKTASGFGGCNAAVVLSK